MNSTIQNAFLLYSEASYGCPFSFSFSLYRRTPTKRWADTIDKEKRRFFFLPTPHVPRRMRQTIHVYSLFVANIFSRNWGRGSGEGAIIYRKKKEKENVYKMNLSLSYLATLKKENDECVQSSNKKGAEMS